MSADKDEGGVFMHNMMITIYVNDKQAVSL